MRDAGVLYDGDFVVDGNINRFNPTDYSGSSKPGWYVVHLSDWATATFGDWRLSNNKLKTVSLFNSDEFHTWKKKNPDKYKSLRKRQKKQQSDLKNRLATEKQRQHHQVAIRAVDLSESLKEVDTHPYLNSKGIVGHSPLLVNTKGALMIPMYTVTGEIWNHQSIETKSGSNTKRFMKAGRVNELMSLQGSQYDELPRLREIALVEGYADARTVYESTGIPTIAAFSSHNYLAVATMVRNANQTCKLYCVADNDKDKERKNIGLDQATKAAATVNGALVVPFSGDGEPAGDINDFYRQRGKNQVAKLFRSAQISDPISDFDTRLPAAVVIEVGEFIDKDIPPKEFILGPCISKAEVSMLFAARGIGKTWCSTGIAIAAATGGQFLRWNAPKARRVLFVDGEMNALDLQLRFRTQQILCGGGDDSGYLGIVTPDLQDFSGGNIDLSREQHRDWLLGTIKEHDIDFLVLDNLSTLAAGHKENDADSWAPIGSWLIKLKTEGVAVLMIHHSGKNPATARGTSRREDILESCICLSRPADYGPEQGARFNIEYKKSRNISDDQAKSFQVTAIIDNDGNITSWKCTDLGEEVERLAFEMFDANIRNKEIQEELNISASKASRLKKKYISKKNNTSEIAEKKR